MCACAAGGIIVTSRAQIAGAEGSVIKPAACVIVDIDARHVRAARIDIGIIASRTDIGHRRTTTRATWLIAAGAMTIAGVNQRTGKPPPQILDKTELNRARTGRL